jgi:hypothetical protein
MNKPNKNSKGASATAKGKGQSKTAATSEKLSDGDRIYVTSEDSASHWSGAYIFRAFFEDTNGKYPGACIYSEDFVPSQAGTLALTFARVKFWTKWKGETGSEYRERQKRIIAEFREKNPQGETSDLFWGENAMGENGVRGFWSKPEIGPAFRLEPITDTFIRPNDGDMVEVHPRGESDMRYLPKGMYLGIAQKISTLEYFGTYTSKNKRTMERVRYTPPMFPFLGWVQFRWINKDGTPKSDWQRGPRFEEWQKEVHEAERIEAIRVKREKEEAAFKAYIDWKNHIDGECDKEKDYDGCAVFLETQLSREITIPLPDSDKRISYLRTRLDHYEKILARKRGTVPSNNGVNLTELNGTPAKPLAFRSIWISSEEGLALLNNAMRAARMIDDEGRWITSLETIGEFCRELPPCIPSKRKGRIALSNELLVPQSDGFGLVTVEQLDNAFRRGNPVGSEVTEIVRQVKALNKVS